jgi:hypothetical protein
MMDSAMMVMAVVKASQPGGMGKGPAAMHAMPMIIEAEATLLVLPRSRTIQEVRPFCTSNIAQQYRSILAHPGQQLYPPNGSCFNFSDRH